MNRKLPGIAVLPCLLLCFGCKPGKPPLPVKPNIEEAPYVFMGTVTAAQKSPVALVPAGDDTYAVRVDEILFQKGVFADLTGDEITVVDSEGRLVNGGQYLFYTEPIVFGRSVAVHLVEARRDARADATAVRDAHDRKMLDNQLRAADLIVAGRIEAVESFPQERELLSEHWPDLHVAILDVERVLKGEIAGGERLQFLFAASLDVHWFQAPKVEKGQTAIFLLESGSNKALAPDIGKEHFTLFRPQSVQPMKRMDIIEELLP